MKNLEKQIRERIKQLERERANASAIGAILDRLRIDSVIKELKSFSLHAEPSDTIQDSLTWRESNLITINQEGCSEIYIDGELLKGVTDVNIKQDMDESRLGIAHVTVSLWISAIKKY